ncbi:uncharacterized protein K452DRAFT_289442 [Aplosporella prunicola CBS 121167]|uniref:Swi5-dependent recombination DNA repair protein 1 n=1 Tax=Aplosporella prunicola CBS 121167 TaxID=1176127 RepID=A0A6A6BC60_9PEZI|nr:uncharacterized protein K452DRAFT_289442 [Aplosporella prunicola CBS 121167]KAF2140051.1 hypothetical protein K452DRAFT_289442 [Aplosporella prunicola CBS 121167]
MLTPAAKRRRLDDAQSALRKPFKSPFKTPMRSSAANGEETVPSTAGRTPPSQSVAASQSPIESNDPPASSIDSDAQDPQTPLPSRVSAKPASIPRKKPDPDDPLECALKEEQQRQRQLNRQMTNLRTELDTLDQALSIASSTKDAELDELIIKWREASRAAAEEVFATVRDRVNRMGGVGAWREREQRQREWRNNFQEEKEESSDDDDDDEEDEEDEDGNPLTPEQKEERKILKERRKEAKEEAKREREWRKEEWENEKRELEKDQPKIVDEGKDDDSFTMDMMLKTLGVELSTIGWDKQGQRWVG